MKENRKNLDISHLLEHILTESWTKCDNNCAQYRGKTGIITNAFTSDTIINYYGKGLHQHRKEILEYIVSITTKPKIHTERISVEKKAVKEELDSEMNDPAWKIGFELNKFYYKCYVGLKNVQNFPLQIKNLEYFGKKELENYCNEIYTPANIFFVIAGKFNEEDRQLQLIYTIQVSDVTGTMTTIETAGDNTQEIIQEIYHVLEDF